MSQARPAIALRPATLDDIATLYEIHRAASQEYVAKTWGQWDEPWQQDYFRERFDCAHRKVIELDQRPIGFLDVTYRADDVFLAAIEIDPAYQRQGIGAALIRDIIANAGALRLPVRLQVLKVNERARALYQRLGFVETGETKTHFLMQK